MSRPCYCDKVETCHRCKLYHTNEDYRRYWDNDKPPGPGTQLMKLLHHLGVHPGNCRCNKRAKQMDEWGPEGCRTHRDEIAGWLREEAASNSWRLLATALARTVTTGLVFSLSPLDPFGSLVDEAIRRAS